MSEPYIPPLPGDPLWASENTTETLIYEPDEETIERETRTVGLDVAGHVIEAMIANDRLRSHDPDMIANEIVSMANYFALFIRTGDT